MILPLTCCTSDSLLQQRKRQIVDMSYSQVMFMASHVADTAHMVQPRNDIHVHPHLVPLSIINTFHSSTSPTLTPKNLRTYKPCCLSFILHKSFSYTLQMPSGSMMTKKTTCGWFLLFGSTNFYGDIYIKCCDKTKTLAYGKKTYVKRIKRFSYRPWCW